MSHDRPSPTSDGASTMMDDSLRASGDEVCVAALDTLIKAASADPIRFADAGIAGKAAARAMIDVADCLFPAR